MSIGNSFYYPSISYISSVEQGQTTIVEFTAPHEFTVGEVISFKVGKYNGMVELNNQQAIVQEITTFTVTVPIVSANYTAFVVPLKLPAFPAIAVPVGTANVPQSIPMQSNLQDTFDNKPYNPLG